MAGRTEFDSRITEGPDEVKMGLTVRSVWRAHSHTGTHGAWRPCVHPRAPNYPPPPPLLAAVAAESSAEEPADPPRLLLRLLHPRQAHRRRAWPLHVYMHIYIYIYRLQCILHIYIYTHTTHAYTYIYIYIYIHVCIYIYIYIYIYMSRKRSLSSICIARHPSISSRVACWFFEGGASSPLRASWNPNFGAQENSCCGVGQLYFLSSQVLSLPNFFSHLFSTLGPVWLQVLQVLVWQFVTSSEQ